MKQNENKLLVNDLSARVPFGVKVEYKGGEYDLVAVYSDGSASLKKIEDNGGFVKFRTSETPKPYLRPMTKMDEAEYDHYGKMLYNIGDLYVRLSRTDALFDFFNEHHFDHRGLIEKGLALEAPEGMYGSFGNLGTRISSEYTKPRAAFPGSFDPFTLAHLHICKKAMPFFDITVLVCANPNKIGSMFTSEQRVDMIRSVFDGCDGVHEQQIKN